MGKKSSLEHARREVDKECWMKKRKYENEKIETIEVDLENNNLRTGYTI